ncbi:MAG: ArsR family transcriptional regulator [Candidatus Izimaplasma sp.]|nr:ArsR family transcriptional regulator [Candidatus Izimaplasma bacterium]
MKFIYQKETSKIYDYILFPRLYYIDNEIEKVEENFYEGILDKKYIELAKSAKEKLSPYKNVIDKFYHEDIYSNYDFVNILFYAFPLEDIKDFEEYFEKINSYNGTDLKRILLNAIIKAYDEETTKIENYSNDADVLNFINKLEIEPKYKWTLLLMMQSPQTYVKDFFDLLTSVKPIFDSLYNNKDVNLIEIGEELVTKLKDNPEETIKEITYGSVSFNVLDMDVTYVYVSYFFPYTLRVISLEKYNYFIWGYTLEETFKKVNQINQDKQIQRVKIFKALGDNTRYNTLKLIAEGTSSTKKIANALDVSSATISYHLNEFVNTGIINIDNRNRKAGYVINYDLLNNIFEDLKNDLLFPNKKTD